MHSHVDPDQITPLARAIASADAQEFRNQNPAYVTDIAGETRIAVAALHADPIHCERYRRFVADMVYGERPEFDKAMGTVDMLTEMVW